MRKMTGRLKSENKPVSIVGHDSNKDQAVALNTFYLRFDTNDFADELWDICKDPPSPNKKDKTNV